MEKIKVFFPFIPIIGILLVLIYKIRFYNMWIFTTSAIVQAVSFNLILLLIYLNIK